MDVIKFGYKSALNNQAVVESAITDLVNNGFVVSVEKPYFASPLSVAESSTGKKRLILDLSVLNNFIWKEKIKYDDWKTFENFIDYGIGRLFIQILKKF